MPPEVVYTRDAYNLGEEAESLALLRDVANFFVKVQRWSAQPLNEHAKLEQLLRAHLDSYDAFLRDNDGGSSVLKRKRGDGGEGGPAQGAGPSPGGNALHGSPEEQPPLASERKVSSPVWDDPRLHNRGYDMREIAPNVSLSLQTSAHQVDSRTGVASQRSTGL